MCVLVFVSVCLFVHICVSVCLCVYVIVCVSQLWNVDVLLNLKLGGPGTARHCHRFTVVTLKDIEAKAL